MASTSSNKPGKKIRKLRPSSETVRERSEGAQIVPKSSEPTKIRTLFRRVGRLKIWKPFLVVGRFLYRFLIPPYFKNSWKEMRLVTWPDFRQTKRLTVAVIIFSIIFGVLVAVVDFILDKIFKKVILHI